MGSHLYNAQVLHIDDTCNCLASFENADTFLLCAIFMGQNYFVEFTFRDNFNLPVVACFVIEHF